MVGDGKAKLCLRFLLWLLSLSDEARGLAWRLRGYGVDSYRMKSNICWAGSMGERFSLLDLRKRLRNMRDSFESGLSDPSSFLSLVLGDACDPPSRAKFQNVLGWP